MSSTSDPAGENSGDKPSSDSFDPLLINTPVDSLSSSDIPDSLVEPSLSDTILLQNVHFDSNLFDGVNLELTNNNNTDSSDFNLVTESEHSMSLLDNLELQILKEVQSSSQPSSHKFLNSSDPLVSSTTTLFPFEDSQNGSQAEEEHDNLEFKYFDETCDSLVGESSNGTEVVSVSRTAAKGSATVASIVATGKTALETVSAASVMLEAIPSTLDIKSAISLPDGTFVNEKLFLTTTSGPMATLSLANMKVLSSNMVASVIIGGERSDCKKENPLLPSTAQVQIVSKQPEVKAKPTTAGKECKSNRTKDENVKSANKGTGGKEAKGSNSTASSSGSSGDSSQFTDADSNSGNPSSKAFVPCKVCGDKASGYHYGVTSCEGCKGFFRRSIQKQIEYRCLRDGKCLIIRLNRNRCQYCRFKKCLAVGMSRDSVRYGRVPKKSKEKERLEEKSRVTQAEADQSSNTDVDSKDLALYDTILTISQAHHANCSYTDDKIKGLSKKPIFMLSQIKSEVSECSSPDIGSVSESLEAQKIELWEHLALLITPCIQRVVEFAKRIPGFSDLTQDDQLILIKLGFFEVWLVHISKTADFVDNTLTFADGSFLSRKQLELMFNHEFVGNLFHLMSGLTNLNLNDTEIGLFSAIILLQPDRPRIYDVKAINQNQETILEALKVQINRNHSGDFQTFQKLMMKINELRALGSSHSLHLQWFRSNWSRLKLPPLFAEIFDIPKSSAAAFASQASSSVSPVAIHSVADTKVGILPPESAIEPYHTHTASPIENHLPTLSSESKPLTAKVSTRRLK